MKSLVAVSLLLLSSCGLSSATIQHDEMNRHASRLTKLSAALESEVRYGDLPAGLGGDALLERIRKQRPELLEGLSDYRIQIANEERHALVLVCTKSGARALMEDAGCTGPLDARHWEREDAPCRFSISVRALCKPD